MPGTAPERGEAERDRHAEPGAGPDSPAAPMTAAGADDAPTVSSAVPTSDRAVDGDGDAPTVSSEARTASQPAEGEVDAPAVSGEGPTGVIPAWPSPSASGYPPAPPAYPQPAPTSGPQAAQQTQQQPAYQTAYQQAGPPPPLGFPQLAPPTASYAAPGSPANAPGTGSVPPGAGPVPPGSPGMGPVPPGSVPPPGAPPGYPVHPGYPYPVPGMGPQPGSGIPKSLKIVGAAAAAVLIALCSGIGGGLIAEGSSEPQKTVTLTNAPPLERASLADVAANIQPSVVNIRAGEGEGSGIVLSADGAIMTNNHVLASGSGSASTGSTVEVTFSDGKTASATVVGTDPASDVGVIKVQGASDLKPAKIGNSDALRVGDTVLALGSPLGLKGSVTEGIVSALHRTISPGSQGEGSSGSSRSIGDAIQTDAAINPGNSGGALANLAGEVIGMNTAIATASEGSGNIGVGFAIPSNKAKRVADQLLAGGKVTHPYLGVNLTDGKGGALIADVVAGGPAEKAGLRKGDLVTAAGDRKVSDANDLVSAVQAGKPGDPLDLTVQRGGTEQKLTVTLGDTPR